MTAPKVEALSLHLAENKLHGEGCSALPPLLCIVLDRLSLSPSLSSYLERGGELPYGCSEARRPKGALH